LRWPWLCKTSRYERGRKFKLAHDPAPQAAASAGRQERIISVRCGWSGSTTVFVPLNIRAEAEEGMPKIKKAGGVSAVGRTFLPKQYNIKLTFRRADRSYQASYAPAVHGWPGKAFAFAADHNHPVRYRNVWIRELK